MKITRKMNGRFLCISALFLGLAFPILSRADDLDVLLAQPPSASLSSEDAAHRIEMLRSFVAAHPERQDEIEAYLIPFVRATQPPLVVPAPIPAPAPAKPRPLLLLKGPDGVATTMRAVSYRKQGAVILVVADNGSHAVFQAATVTGELSWYSENELESGAVDLNAQALRYETFAKAMPALRAVLKTEATRLRKMQQARDDAATAKQNATQSRLAQVTSATYEPAAGYTADKLAKMLLAAEKARNEMPGSAEKIDQWAAPFREHFTKLLAGWSFRNDAWVSNLELARQAREKRQAAFLSGLDYQIGTEPYPAGSARGLTAVPSCVGLFALAAGAGLVIFGRKKIFLLIPGTALLAVTPLAMATMFFLATRNPPLLPLSIPMTDEQPIVDILSQAAGLEDGAASQQISDQALNWFLARHVRLAPAGNERATDTRQAMVVRLFPGRLAIFQMIRSAGLDWIVRIDLDCAPANGGISLALSGAKVGALDCPVDLAAALWENLKPQFAAILSASHVGERFAIQSPINGSIELKALEKPASSAN